MTKELKEGEGMCDSCKKYTKQGLYIKNEKSAFGRDYLCRECRNEIKTNE